MGSHEAIKRKIETANELHSLVRTMKAMAAVNIRQLEKSAESLVDFRQTIELGLKAVARLANPIHSANPIQKNGKKLVLVFGSDQGMCGTMNEHLANAAVQEANQIKLQADVVVDFVAIGDRVAGKLSELNVDAARVFHVPSSIPGITPLVNELLIQIDQWRSREKVNQVFITYCQRNSKTDYEAKFARIFPVDQHWLSDSLPTKWPTNQIPMMAQSADKLFSGLFRQFLFFSLFNASVESQVCENANRMVSMQRAEKNIDSQLEILNSNYHQQRQMEITEELLDIASGFEAIDSAE